MQERQVGERTERLAAQRAELERALADQAAPTDYAAQPSAAALAGVAAAGPHREVGTSRPTNAATSACHVSGSTQGGESPQPRDGDQRGFGATEGQGGPGRQVSYRQGATVRHTDGTLRRDPAL